MNIGIIGAGNIGASAARLFADAGHAVAISNSRGPEPLASLVEEIGPNACAATVEDAATFGEVVLVAIPFWRYESLPAGPLSGKIVVDAMNYYAGRDGQMDFGDLTSSELLARRLPDARGEGSSIEAHRRDRFRAGGHGFLGDGWRKQQPGSPIYNTSMTAEQARETLADLR